MICFIPAKGTSQRLPKKNILPVQGRPMISYPIKAAIKSGIFRRVIISTDDDEISEIAQSYDVEVMNRPQSLRKLDTTIDDLLIHSLPACEAFCCLYATAVLITPETLQRASQWLRRADFIMGVNKYRHHKPLFSVLDDWLIEPGLAENNGSFCFCNYEAFFRAGTVYGPTLMGYECENIDIDTAEDYNNLLRRLCAESKT